MNYEERYKQAIEAAKRELHCCGSLDCDAARQIFRLFPELRESEDEKIRKEIIQSIKDSMCVIHKDKCLAWLEKQGEKIIPEDVNKAALQYVDTCPVDGEVTHYNITEPYWNNHSMMNAYKAGWLEKQGEQSSWSEEDEKMLDSIIDCLDGLCFIDSDQLNWLKSLKPRWKPTEEQMGAMKYFISFHRPQANAAVEG